MKRGKGRKRTYTEKVGARTGLNDARARKEAALARLRELDLAEREGRLLPIESHTKILAAIIGELRARIVASPGKYATRIVGLHGVAQAQTVLEDMFNDLLSVLRTAGRDVRDRMAGS